MGYRFDPAEELGEAFRRVAREQLAAIITGLVLAGGDKRDAIHNARQRFKALRGLLRLVRPADEKFFAREDRRYRDLGRLLAHTREAGALVEAIDRLASLPALAGAETTLSAVRARLVEREQRVFGDKDGAERAMAKAAAGCRAGLRVLDDLALPAKPRHAAAIVGRGVKGTYAEGARALVRVRKDGRLGQFHALRKSVKYHWMHVRLLQPAWPGPMNARRVAAKALSGDLGELNDIAVMLARLMDDPHAFGSGGEVETLAGLLNRRRGNLERASLQAAGRLFAENPKSIGRRVARYWHLAAKEAVREAAREAAQTVARQAASKPGAAEQAARKPAATAPAIPPATVSSD